MAITEVFAGVAAADLSGMVEWYERLVGRPPDMRPNDNEAAWQLTDTGWIYLVGDVGRSGSALVTILVDDLDDRIAELGERGLATGVIETVPGVVRTAVILDPEGNTIQFGEPAQPEAP